MNPRLVFLPFFLLAALPAAAQTGMHYGLIAGYHGMEHHFAEVGAGFANSPKSAMVGGSLSAEMRVDESFVLGATYSVWTSSNPLAAGFSLSYFNNFRGNGTFRFRPEIGLGLGYVRIVYGYSMEIGRGTLDAGNRHDVAIRAFVPILTRI
jgi:hypothetical protein